MDNHSSTFRRLFLAPFSSAKTMPASMLETLVAQRGATGVLFPPLNFAQVLPGPSVRLLSLIVMENSFPTGQASIALVIPTRVTFPSWTRSTSRRSCGSSAKRPNERARSEPDLILARRYLSTDEYRTDTRTWATEQGLNIVHLPIDVSKDPTIEVDEALVRQAIEVVLGEQSNFGSQADI